MRNKSAQHILIRIRTIINILTWYTLHTLKRRRILRISFEIFRIILLNSVALLSKITRMRLNVSIVTKLKNIDIFNEHNHLSIVISLFDSGIGQTNN